MRALRWIALTLAVCACSPSTTIDEEQTEISPKRQIDFIFVMNQTNRVEAPAIIDSIQRDFAPLVVGSTKIDPMIVLVAPFGDVNRNSRVGYGYCLSPPLGANLICDSAKGTLDSSAEFNPSIASRSWNSVGRDDIKKKYLHWCTRGTEQDAFVIAKSQAFQSPMGTEIFSDFVTNKCAGGPSSMGWALRQNSFKVVIQWVLMDGRYTHSEFEAEIFSPYRNLWLDWGSSVMTRRYVWHSFIDVQPKSNPLVPYAAYEPVATGRARYLTCCGGSSAVAQKFSIATGGLRFIYPYPYADETPPPYYVKTSFGDTMKAAYRAIVSDAENR